MSPPSLRIELSPEEDQTLHELTRAASVPVRTRERAEALRLSHRGWKPAQIAEHFGWNVATARTTLYRWQHDGLMGLWDAPRPGRTPRWTEEDMKHVEKLLRDEQQTYTSSQLVAELAQQRQVDLSRRQLRRILKKKTTVGNGLVSPTVVSKTQ
jgi:transposase